MVKINIKKTHLKQIQVDADEATRFSPKFPLVFFGVHPGTIFSFASKLSSSVMVGKVERNTPERKWLNPLLVEVGGVHY